MTWEPDMEEFMLHDVGCVKYMLLLETSSVKYIAVYPASFRFQILDRQRRTVTKNWSEKNHDHNESPSIHVGNPRLTSTAQLINNLKGTLSPPGNDIYGVKYRAGT